MCGVGVVGHPVLVAMVMLGFLPFSLLLPPLPQLEAAEAEIIKVPSVENSELKRSPFKAWSRSLSSYTSYAYN